MRCPFCGHSQDRVVDSRQSKDAASIRRRRECESCNGRFTTHERVEELNLQVIKKGGGREPFIRTKIRSGILLACRKRSVSVEQIDGLVDDIERSLLSRGDREIPADLIGGEVMERLRGLDDVAYVRFASVYRKFEDVEEFVRELEGILDDRLRSRTGNKSRRS